MIKQQLARFHRLDLLGSTTALEKLERLSAWIGRDIYVKRDDTTPLAMGGNKLRKLEYLAADALAQGADTLITAGAIQSNHVRQTAALAAKLEDVGRTDAANPAAQETIDSFVDEVAHLLRSQIAGIVGNLLLVMPVVLLAQGLT